MQRFDHRWYDNYASSIIYLNTFFVHSISEISIKISYTEVLSMTQNHSKQA
jgi:hypothetical protein